MTAPADIRLTADEAYALLLDRVGGAATWCHVRGDLDLMARLKRQPCDCPGCVDSGSRLLRWIAERIAAPPGGR